jgi:branched-chain amino acid transport system substrate-binding protein
MPRTWLRYLAVFGALAVVLTACGPAEEPADVAEETPVVDDEDDEATPEEPTPDEPTPEEPAEEDPLGEWVIGPDEPIKIAAHQAISGDTIDLGTDQVRAVEIAIEDRDGELMGHPIELTVEDDECRAEGGTAGAQRIVADPDIIGVIGTSCSGAAVPALGIYSREGMVLISGSNTSPSLTSDFQGNPGDAWQEGYYRIAHNDLTQGAAAAKFAFDELGAQTAAAIHDGDPYTQGLTSAFRTSFEELGGEVVFFTGIDPDGTDFRAVLTEVAATNPDLVFYPIFQPAADHLTAQALEFDELADGETLMAADGLLSDSFLVLDDTENIYFSGPATPEGPAYEELVDKYQEEYGELPIQSFHAHAYDAVNMLFAAIEEVAVHDDGTTRIGKQALRDALTATEGFEGLTGTLTCDEFGDCAAPRINIVRRTADAATSASVRANVLATYEFDAEGNIVD